MPKRKPEPDFSSEPMHKSFIKWQLSRYENMSEAEKLKHELFANMNPLDGVYHRLYNVDIPRHARIINEHEVAWDYNRRVWVLFMDAITN